MEMDYTIRAIEKQDGEFIESSLKKNRGSVKIVTRGKLYDASKLPGFLAEGEKQTHGFITYRIDENEVEIISLNSFKERVGIGSSLIDAVKKVAESKSMKRIWLITTNDNYPAVSFYQRRGFRVKAIHKNAIEQSRKLKPEIPVTGSGGVPIKDEIEMEMFVKKIKLDFKPQ